MIIIEYSSLEKSSAVIDNAVYHSLHVPSYYKQPHFDVYKERSPVIRLRNESDKEKDIKVKLW